MTPNPRFRDGAIHGTREKRANIRCNEAHRSGKYATEDGDAREARDGTSLTKRSDPFYGRLKQEAKTSCFYLLKDVL